VSFEHFGLPPNILKSLAALKFETPTPIQEKAIPLGLLERDIMGMAQTGTGKTGAFGIPLVTKVLADPRKNVLVLAPTRELAVQIHEFFKMLLADSPQIVSALLIGGTSMRFQLKELGRRPRILIATPGRLADHLSRRKDLLQQTHYLVLDEADRMLDMGFLPQLNRIKAYLPKERQTYMFSATFPKNIRALAHEFLKNPVEISVGDSRPIQKIKQVVIETTQKDKNNKLVSELRTREGTVLIFARTKHRTNRLTRFLNDAGQRAAKIHGDCSQGQRQQAIENFRSGKIRVLVATDIASRGIDIADIGHVINYDLPQAPEDYVHRIGRTGRNGKEGNALAMLTPEDKSAWRAIARLAGLPAPAGRDEPVTKAQGQNQNRPQRQKPRGMGKAWGGRPSRGSGSGPSSGPRSGSRPSAPSTERRGW
jgi:ATP-dependent RNA helicase DeaD